MNIDTRVALVYQHHAALPVLADNTVYTEFNGNEATVDTACPRIAPAICSTGCPRPIETNQKKSVSCIARTCNRGIARGLRGAQAPPWLWGGPRERPKFEKSTPFGPALATPVSDSVTTSKQLTQHGSVTGQNDIAVERSHE